MIAPLLRLVARTWWVFLLIGGLFAVLAGWHATQWRGAEPVEVGRGPAGTPVVLSAELGNAERLLVYGLGTPAEDGFACRSAQVDHLTVFRDRDYPQVDVAGEQWRLLGTVDSRAVPGDVVFCPAQGITEVMVVDDVPGRARLMTLVFLAAAVVFTLAAPIYRAVGRRAPQPT